MNGNRRQLMANGKIRFGKQSGGKLSYRTFNKLFWQDNHCRESF